jgi:hypothetical protein
MDDRGAVELMARVQCFTEVLFGAECSAIERHGDDDPSHFECQIWTRWHQYELQSTAGLVRLCAQALDSTASDPTLIVEVQTVDERSMATLRGCIAALETISQLRQTKNVAGLRMLQRVLSEALGVPDVRVRGRRWL